VLTLNSPSTSPFCTEYRLIDQQNRGNWLGYACGAIPTTVFAIAVPVDSAQGSMTQAASIVSTTTTGDSAHTAASTTHPTTDISPSTSMHSTKSGNSAMTRTTTGFSPSYRSSTSLPTSSGLSSGQIGGIATGVIVAIVILASVLGLAYYRAQVKHRQRQAEIRTVNLGAPAENRALMQHLMHTRGGPYYVYSDERGQF
jgi:hypothetical protein